MEDIREDLINELCMGVIPYGINAREIKSLFYVILDKYEIQSRCTKVAVLQEQRNEYLLKKFIIAKTVKGCTKRTIEFYTASLKKTLEIIGKTVDDITADDIRMYEGVRLVRDKVSKTTVGNEMRNMSSFFGWLRNEELIASNPMARVDRIKREKTKKEALTEIEIEKIRNSTRSAKERAIIEILLSTGCRVTELVNIKIADIYGNRVLLHGKGEKDRYAYLNAKAIVATNEYLEMRRDKNQYLFPRMISVCDIKKKTMKKYAYAEIWKDPEVVEPDGHMCQSSVEGTTRRIAKRAGVSRANPHKFRRTCATLALKRGMPLMQVSKMLGHESVETTQIYLDLNEDELKHAHGLYVL